MIASRRRRTGSRQIQHVESLGSGPGERGGGRGRSSSLSVSDWAYDFAGPRLVRVERPWVATGVERRARFLGRRPDSFRRSFLAAAFGVLMGSGIGCSVSTLCSSMASRSPSSNTTSSVRVDPEPLAPTTVPPHHRCIHTSGFAAPRGRFFCKLELELLGVSEVDATPVRDTSVDEYRALFLLPPRQRPVEKTRTFFLALPSHLDRRPPRV